MGIFRDGDQAGYLDHAIDNLKIDALSIDATKENQQNSIKNRTEVTSSKDSDKQHYHSHIPQVKSNHCNEEYTVLGNKSTEVLEIYLATQNSNLECTNKPSHYSVSTNGHVESDKDAKFDDFNPYLFMKKLPKLSTLVPKFRPTFMPKQKRSSTTLVLDLDETLVHSTEEPCEDMDFTFQVSFNLKRHTFYVRCRPNLTEFLERVASMFEVVIYTAGLRIYAEQIVNVLDPNRILCHHRFYRESCLYVKGHYLKDLSAFGRDLARVIIIDNSPQVFGFQVDNGIPIKSWYGDRTDRELLLLLPFLESLVGVDDVRPLIAKKFNIREKIAAAK